MGDRLLMGQEARPAHRAEVRGAPDGALDDHVAGGEHVERRRRAAPRDFESDLAVRRDVAGERAAGGATKCCRRLQRAPAGVVHHDHFLGGIRHGGGEEPPRGGDVGPEDGGAAFDG